MRLGYLPSKASPSCHELISPWPALLSDFRKTCVWPKMFYGEDALLMSRKCVRCRGEDLCQLCEPRAVEGLAKKIKKIKNPKKTTTNIWCDCVIVTEWDKGAEARCAEEAGLETRGLRPDSHHHGERSLDRAWIQSQENKCMLRMHWSDAVWGRKQIKRTFHRDFNCIALNHFTIQAQILCVVWIWEL